MYERAHFQFEVAVEPNLEETTEYAYEEPSPEDMDEKGPDKHIKELRKSEKRK